MATTVTLTGGAGYCNAVRRSLIADVGTWAPHELVVRENTSCFTNELLAHRVGLIPFRRVGNGDELELSVQGPAVVRAAAFTGPAFVPVHPEIEVATLTVDQTLEFTVRFDRRTGTAHARYAPCCGVGMERRGDVHLLRFEPVDGAGVGLVLEALERLEARANAALRALAHQDTIRVTSMI